MKHLPIKDDIVPDAGSSFIGRKPVNPGDGGTQVIESTETI